MKIDEEKEAIQRDNMVNKAPKATELVVIGMAERGDEMFSADSEGVEPEFWDVYLKFNLVGDEWDIEETSFHTEEEASDFADKLQDLVPDDVCIEAL